MQLTVTKVRVAAPILHYVFRAVQQLSELSASRPRAPMSHRPQPKRMPFYFDS